MESQHSHLLSSSSGHWPGSWPQPGSQVPARKGWAPAAQAAAFQSPEPARRGQPVTLGKPRCPGLALGSFQAWLPSGEGQGHPRASAWSLRREPELRLGPRAGSARVVHVHVCVHVYTQYMLVCTQNTRVGLKVRRGIQNNSLLSKLATILCNL